MYFLGEVKNGSGTTILRKVDINDQDLWMSIINNNPDEVTLGISQNEQYLFYTSNIQLSLTVVNTTTGQLIQWYTNNAITADPHSSSAFITSDNSAVYFNQVNNTAAFWKFNLTSNSGDWYSISSGCKLKIIDFSKTKFK